MHKLFASNINKFLYSMENLFYNFYSDCYEGCINEEYLEKLLSEILENEDIPRKIEESAVLFVRKIQEEARSYGYSDWVWLLEIQNRIQEFIDTMYQDISYYEFVDTMFQDISYYSDSGADNDDIDFVPEKDPNGFIRDICNFSNELMREPNLLPTDLQKEKIDWSGRICDFVKNFSGVATEQAIRKEFLHLPNGALYEATIKTPIVNMNGYYRHMDQLGITDSEKEQWKAALDVLLMDNNVYHFKELADKLKVSLSLIFERTGVHDYLQMYYISAKLFSRDFYFMRPYISRQVINNESKAETALNKLMASKFFLVSDIKEYLEKYFSDKIDYHEFLESRDDIIFLGERKYTFIDNLDLRNDIAFDVLDDCLDSIFDREKGYCSLKKFKCYEKLPNIGYEWNDWLLYSMILLYSEKYTSKAIEDSLGKIHLYVLDKNDSQKEIIPDVSEEFDVDSIIDNISLDELEEYLQ